MATVSSPIFRPILVPSSSAARKWIPAQTRASSTSFAIPVKHVRGVGDVLFVVGEEPEQHAERAARGGAVAGKVVLVAGLLI
jgi:hypothetical protein